MKIAVYPGSFDPATYGHLDVIRRAAVSFDKVIVGVLHNSSKSPLFSVQERVNILEKATRDVPNVEVKPFEGLSVNFARENHAQVIIRGLRAVTDFEYELQMAQTNRVLAPDVDTPLSLQNYDPDIVPDIHKLRFWLNKKVRFVRVGLFAFIANSFYTKNKEDTLLGVPSLFL